MGENALGEKKEGGHALLIPRRPPQNNCLQYYEVMDQSDSSQEKDREEEIEGGEEGSFKWKERRHLEQEIAHLKK